MSYKQILIVEDDVWLAQQHQRTLERGGFAVRVAPDALAAIDLIDELLPDVIILDVLLAGPNGLTLLHELRSYPDLAAIPVILCSNTVPDLSSQDLKTYGIQAILDKSTMHPSDIIKAIKRLEL